MELPFTEMGRKAGWRWEEIKNSVWDGLSLRNLVECHMEISRR
jgi:hypothetical protein